MNAVGMMEPFCGFCRFCRISEGIFGKLQEEIANGIMKDENKSDIK